MGKYTLTIEQFKEFIMPFISDAITFDEQPTSFKESWKQRKRWSIGTVQCFKIYSMKLVKSIMRTGNFSCFDTLIFLVSPMIQFLGLASYILHIVIGLLQISYINYIGKIATLGIWYLISIILSVVTIKYAKKHIKPYLKGILTLPLFFLSWMPINIIACFKQKNSWEKIEHTRDIAIEKVVEIDYK